MRFLPALLCRCALVALVAGACAAHGGDAAAANGSAAGNGGSGSAAPSRLRVSWGPHNAPPYAILDGRQQLAGGVIHDLGLAVGRRAGVDVVFVDVPRARYEAQMRDGHVDLTCITNPQWLQAPDDFEWSPPLFEEADIVVQQRGSQPWKSVADLSGRQLATIQSYRYPSLERLFAAGHATRSDGADLDSNLRRLALGRVDAVVDADIPVRWWLSRNANGTPFTIAAFEVSRHAVYCAISRKAPAGSTRLREAFEQMVRDGSLRSLLGPYLPARD